MVPESDSKYVIYGLCEPGDATALRYVGKTANLKCRISSHWSSNGEPCHRINWINRLKSCGTKFEVIILDRCDSIEEMSEREAYLISLYMWSGFDLANTWEPAGPGRLTCSEEVRKKIGIANSGKTPSAETRAKMSAAHKGKPSGKKGVPMSEETKKKLSIAKTGTKMSLETRAKMAAWPRATMSEETRQLIKRKAQGVSVGSKK